MLRENPYLPWHKYPKEDDLRTGCKVSWHYYRSKEDAEKCAEAAKHNARIQRWEGYDFGYCAPGSITLMKAGKHAGMYGVCLP